MKYKLRLSLLIVLGFFIMLSGKAYSDCGGGGTLAGSLSMLPTFQTISVNAGQRYTFTAYASVTYIFTFCQGGGSNSIDTQIEVCNQSGTTVYSYNDDHCGLGSEITWNCSTNGTYSIVIHQYSCNDGGAAAGTLAYETITPPNEQDCLGAIPLCFNTYNTTTSYSGTGHYLGEIPVYGGATYDDNCPGNCLLNGEINDVWYTFTVQTSGTVSFIITPNDSDDDYDWAVYNLTNAECVDIATNSALQVSCNFCGTAGSTGPSGASSDDCQHGNSCTNFNDDLDVVAGETYVVNVSNWTATQSGYTISFGGTAQIVDNTGPYIESILYAPECGASSLTLQFSERLWCTSVQPSDFTITGPEGTYNVAETWSTVCEAGLGSTYGDTYYDDIWTLELSDYLQHDGDYTLTVHSGAIDDICSNYSPQSSVNFTIDGISADTVYGHSSCYGEDNGWAQVTNISGATAPYSINWTGPNGFTSTNANISNLEPGAYTISIGDVTGRCEFTEIINIGEPDQISFNTTITQPTCGNNNGSIEINVNAGAYVYPPYSIACTGQTTALNTTSHTFNSLGDGSYTITVTDTHGCYETSNINLLSTDNPDASFTYNGNQCLNSQSFNFTHTGTVVPGETYLWTFSGGTPASSTSENPSGITFSTAGAHNVSLTITAGACIDASNVNISVYDLPVPSVVTTDENCGNCDGTAIATAGFSSYAWSTSGGTTNSESNICAGSYTVTVQDANSCTNTENFTINSIGTLPIANVITTQPSCPGVCDGTATTNAVGPSTFTYNYSDGSTPNNQTTGDLCAGAYSVTVADGTNAACLTVENFSITDPTGMTLSMSGTDANCGLNNGSATVSVSGGTMPMSYNWSNGGVTGTINGIPAGNYIVTVTDGNGCTSTNNIIINDTGAPFTVSTSVIQDAQCNGICDGIATATTTGSTGPFSYQWSSGTNPTNFTVTGLCAGTHTVSVTEGACMITETITIAEPSSITGTVTSTDAHCGQSDGSITIAPNGGTIAGDYTYEWDCAPAQFTATASNLPAGTYHVTVTDDNSCTNSFTGSIMDVGGVTINQTHNSTLCSTSSDGSATINVLTGDPDFTFSWSNGVIFNTSTNSHSLNNLASGPYTVTVTDTWGCSAVTNFTINNAPVLNASISASSDATCNGLCDGTATASGFGGTGILNYDWGTGNGDSPNTANNTGLCSGNYTVTITDANSCTATSPVTIDEPTSINLITNIVNAHCGQSDGAASVAASGGTITTDYTYLWSGGTQPTSASNTGLSPAGSPYTVTVTDDNNCTQTATVIIDNELGPTVSISNTSDITCFGYDNGTATISIGGGTGPFSINWNTTPPQNTYTATNLSPGQYYVTVSDIYGCTYEASATINEPSPFSVNAMANDIDCYGTCTGSAYATPSGGTSPYTYLWSDFQNSQMATSLCAGDYEVIVSDNNGCTTTDNTTILENAPIVLSTIITNSNCGQSNGSIDLSITGGSGTMDINWDYGPHTEDLVNIPAGTYTVTVTDNKGCQTTQTFAVNDISGPTLTITSTTDVSCIGTCNGQTTVAVTGGTGPFDYSWNTVPVQTNANATNLCAGTYSVIVTDMTTGCITTSSSTISEPSQLDVSEVLVNPTCNNAYNGEIQLTTFNGTPPYTYTWTGSGTLPSTEDLTNLSAGSYTVAIYDANGCLITRNYVLTEPSFITAPTSVVSSNCNGSCDGQATVNPVGGTPPYTYTWSDINNQTSQTAVNLCPGNFGVTVTDGNGCTTNNVANVPEPTLLTFNSISINNPTCFGLANGDITVSSIGGTPPLSYAWDNGSSTATANNLPAGTHCVTITDVNLCQIDTCITLTEPSEIQINFDITDESCNGFCDGEIQAIVSGGISTYDYYWSNSAISETNTNLCAGLYLLTVTDNNGCQQTSSASIASPNALEIVVQDTIMPTCGNNDGSITVGVIGGTTPYTYEWQSPPGGNSAMLNNIPNGNYTISVTDVHGCSVMHTIDLNDITAPIIDSIIVTNVDCHGNATGEAIVYFTSSTPSNTIQWNDPASQASCQAINLPEGSYTVLITDENGCQASQTIAITEPAPMLGKVDSHTDISCYGFCNGTAVASMTGGTTPETYAWSGGYSGANISGLCQGTYNLTVTDANGCISEDYVVIEEPTEMTLSDNIFPATCYGGSDGSISVNVTGGNGNYDYEWFGTTSNNPVVTGLSSTNYTLVVYNSDDYSCFVTENYFVPQPTEINALFNTVSATCNQDNGSAYVTNTFGGTPGYSYSWTPTGITNTDSIGNLAPGAYQCLVTDTYGCTSQFPVTVDETPAPILDNVITNDVTCYNYHDGTAQINISGGTIPYTYHWNPSLSETNYCDTLPSGLYMVTISDANGCEVFATIPISSPDIVEVIPTGIDTICIGQSTQITATAAGGTSPYEYTWSGLGTGSTHNVNPEITTDYMLIAVDAAGCISEPQSLEIMVNPPLELTVITPSSICNGQTAILSATANGGDGNYIFDWGNGIVTNNPELIISPQTNTDFSITLSDGCGTPETTEEITLTVAPQPQIDITRNPAKGCSPLSIQFDNNTSNYSYTYKWYFDDEESETNNTSELKRPSHYYESPGYYEISLVAITNQGCKDSATINLRISESPIADFIAQPWTAGMFSSNVHFNDESIDATAWLWQFGDNAISTTQNPDYIFTEAGEIPVKLIAYNTIGCTDTITKNVNIIEEHRFYVPTAINVRSPGNDEFYPKGVGIDINTYEMEIFNRWGESIFITNDINEHWQGRYNQNKGEYVQQGIYAWVITLRDNYGKDHTYSGMVTVFK